MVQHDRTAAELGAVTWDPVTIDVKASLAEAQGLMQTYGISCLPVLDKSLGSRLKGILTKRDIRFSSHTDQPVSELMTADRLITVKSEIKLHEAKRLIHQFRIERLLVVNDNYECIGLISASDIRRVENSSELETEIGKAALGAPIFVPINERISHRPKPDTPYVVSERISVARERCSDLLEACELRGNEQPELLRASHDYAKALAQLIDGLGSYRLFIAGITIEDVIQIKSGMPIDSERNPPIGADLLLSVRALLIAHAGLVAVLEDLRSLPQEFSMYADQLSALKQLSEIKPFGPVLEALASSSDLLDKNTQETTKEIALQARKVSEQAAPKRGEIAIEQAWLRGALAAIGNYVVSHVKYLKSKTKDTLTSEAIKGLMYNPGTLASAIYVFLEAAKPYLIDLASNVPVVFGWLRPLLELIGL